MSSDIREETDTLLSRNYSDNSEVPLEYIDKNRNGVEEDLGDLGDQTADGNEAPGPVNDNPSARTQDLTSAPRARIKIMECNDTSDEGRVLCNKQQAEVLILKAEQIDDVDAGVPPGQVVRNKNIALAIFRDDVRALEDIVHENGFDTAFCRIQDVVEYNSLRCLKFLLDRYKELCHSDAEPEITHRRRGLSALNWPACERPQEYPLHIIASRKSDIRMMECFGSNEYFMKKYVDTRDSNQSTPLLVAVKRNNVKVALWLIEYGAKIDARNNEGDSPIKCAALKGQADVIRQMLKTCNSQEEKASVLKDSSLFHDGHTIMYAAAQSRNIDTLQLLTEESTETGCQSWLLDTEMKHHNSGNFVCNVSASGYRYLYNILFEKYENVSTGVDYKQATPLMRAAEADEVFMVKDILLSKTGRQTFGFKDGNGRNVFHYAYKNPHVLTHLLQEHVGLYKDTAVINEQDKDCCTPLKLAADGNVEESFRMLLGYLEQGKEADLFSYPFVGYTSVEVLRIILEKWETDAEDVYTNFLNGTNGFQPPLIGAASKGDVEIIYFLLQRNVNGQARFDDNTALHCAAAGNKLPALKLLLERFPKMINETNDSGQTPIGCAVEMGNVEIVRYLLEKKALLMGNNRVNIFDCGFGSFKNDGVKDAIMEIITFCDKKENPTTLKALMKNSHFGPDRLMAKFVEDIPCVALEILDRCIDRQTELKSLRSGEISNVRKEVYHFFAITSKGKDGYGKLEAIETMIKYRRDKCLTHPLITKFLRKMLTATKAQRVLYLNLCLYIIFLISLTTYIGLQTSGSYSLHSPGLVALSTITIIFCALSIIKELFQAKYNWKEYVSNVDNYLEWVIYICAIIFVVTPAENQQKSYRQITAGAIAVFLAWINFTWYLKIFPRLGIYIIMIKKVMVSVLMVIPMVSLFITAFAMGFLMLMHDDVGFKNLRNSFLTTSVMMTGEIDFRGVFLENDGNPLRPWQQLLLMVFLLLVTIVIMNLLVGLAVDDISAIMQRSKEEERLYEANLAVTLQNLRHRLPLLTPPRDVEDPLDHYPDSEEKTKVSKRFSKFIKRLAEGSTQKYGCVENKEDDDGDRLKNVEDQLEKLSEMHEKIDWQMNQMQGFLERIAMRIGCDDGEKAEEYQH